MVHDVVTVMTLENAIRGASPTGEGWFIYYLYTCPLWVVTNNTFVFSVNWCYAQLNDENLHVAQVLYIFRYGSYWVGFALYNSVEAFWCAFEFSDIGLTMGEVWKKSENPLEPTQNFVFTLFCGILVQGFLPPLLVLPFNNGKLPSFTVNEIVEFDSLSIRSKFNILFVFVLMLAALLNYALIDEDGRPMSSTTRLLSDLYKFVLVGFLLYLQLGLVFNIFREIRMQGGKDAKKEEERIKSQLRLQRIAENFSTLEITKVASRDDSVGKRSSVVNFV